MNLNRQVRQQLGRSGIIRQIPMIFLLFFSALLLALSLAGAVRAADNPNLVPRKNEFNISKINKLQYTYRHSSLSEVQGAKAWRGADYAKAIQADAKGVDSATGQYYLDEWMPDYGFQYFLYEAEFKDKFKDIGAFRANFTKNDLKDLTSLTTDQAKQQAADGGATIYYSALMSMQTLEGLQYATKLQEINLTPNLNVSEKVSGNASRNGNLWDISALKNLNELTDVTIQFFSLNDISALANKPKLKSVYLPFNQIADISPLATNKGNPGLDLKSGFRYQHILLAPITLRTGTQAYISPSFIIKDLQSQNLPVAPYNSETEKDSYPALYPSTSDSQNVDPITLKWTNFLPDPSDRYGSLSSHWKDPNSTFEGWILLPYQLKDDIGNVNVSFQLLREDGNQLQLSPAIVLSGNVGSSYNIGDNADTSYTLTRLIGQQNYQPLMVLDGTGQYKDYLEKNGKANQVDQNGTYTEVSQNRTVLFTKGTSKINVQYGALDAKDTNRFVPFNESGSQAPITVEKEGTIGTALLIDDLKRDFPHYNYVGLGIIQNGKVIKLTDSTVLFGDEPKQVVFLYEKVAEVSIEIDYLDSNGRPLVNVSKTALSGEPDSKPTADQLKQLQKPVDGYTFDHYQDAKGQKITDPTALTFSAFNGRLTLVYQKKSVTPTPSGPSTPATPSTVTPSSSSTNQPSEPSVKPDSQSSAVPKDDVTQPGTIAKKGAAVYALKKVYLYKTKTFKQHQRIAGYVKKPRINRPMFVVTDYAYSKNGVLRYVVRDVNHHSQTAGKKGYLTANWQYVRPVYYQKLHKQITVINPRGVNVYQRKNLTGKVKNLRQGTRLTVTGLVKHHLTTRYVLSNGHYITGNRKLVIAGRFDQPQRIKVKKTIYRYKDVNFNHRLGKVKAGTVLTVKKWLYTHPNSMTTFGVKRYQVQGGFVTAKPQFVKVIK
ncbi:DUF5776 domain-containing protein [Lentilactobacillus raoultii]|uniref:DUF5776 domain-containing protein n=1 Tax=Lentilactobacillus raoultii TaxID=1987503 RepID=A0ABW3PUA2_9LACO|nr:DUF5776 domain-containing protein [Lentilactobacillus raoultii]